MAEEMAIGRSYKAQLGRKAVRNLQCENRQLRHCKEHVSQTVVQNSGIARRTGGFSGYARSENVASESATQHTSILEAFELCAKPSAKIAKTIDRQQAQSSNKSLAEDREVTYSQWFDEWQRDEEGQH